MNKTEFIKAIAEKAEKTQKEVKAILEVAQEVAYTEMANQGEVTVFDGLKLVGVHKDATVARNPMTGGTVDVPEKVVPKAKFGTVAKRTVNGE